MQEWIGQPDPFPRGPDGDEACRAGAAARVQAGIRAGGARLAAFPNACGSVAMGQPCDAVCGQASRPLTVAGAAQVGLAELSVGRGSLFPVELPLALRKMASTWNERQCRQFP